MNRALKEELVLSVREKLSDASLVVVTRQTGLTVDESTQLRRVMREAGAEFKVLKNTLAQLAIKGTPYEGLSTYLTGPTALAFSVDPVSAAKVAVNFAKKNAKLSVVGGFMGGQVIDEKAVKTLADLPSLDELRSKLLGIFNAPATKLAVLAKEPATCIARVLLARSQQA